VADTIRRIAEAFWKLHKTTLARRHAFIFRGTLTRGPILVVGLNPRGPSKRRRPCSSAELYRRRPVNPLWDETEPWRSAYARRLRKFLLDVVPIGLDPRTVPMTNLCFFASPRWANLQDRDLRLENCRPFLRRIIRIVGPDHVIVLGGLGREEHVEAVFRRKKNRQFALLGRHRHRPVMNAWQARLTARSAPVQVYCLPHPSGPRFTGRDRAALTSYLREQLGT